MKSHVYLITLQFQMDEWKTLIHSPELYIDEDYIKDICEEILNKRETKFINESKNSSCWYRKVYLTDIAKNSHKGFSYEYLGHINIHQLNYNIINIQNEKRRLEKTNQRSIS